MRISDWSSDVCSSDLLISNAASSKIYGADVELMLRPSDNFDLSVTYGYLDAKYDSYFTNAAGAPPTAATDFSHRSLVRAPKHRLNVGGDWLLPTGDASEIGRALCRERGCQYE